MLPEQMHELNGIVEIVSYLLASETKKLLNLIPTCVKLCVDCFSCASIC